MKEKKNTWAKNYNPSKDDDDDVDDMMTTKAKKKSTDNKNKTERFKIDI